MNSSTHPLPAVEPDAEPLVSLLSDRRCRAVLAVLLERGPVVALDDLADDVAPRLHEADHGMVPEGARERIRVSLHHHHVPKLDHAGLVDYDTATKTVATLQVEAVSDHLRQFDG